MPHQDASGIARIARHDHDQLGEGPVWDDRTQTLLRVDIAKGRIYRWNPKTGEQLERRVAGEGSAVAPRTNGGLIAAVDHSLVLLDEAGDAAITVIAEVETEKAENRFNDCRCDPQGRLWAGTMSKRRSPGTAGLYRLDPDGQLNCMLGQSTISNGIAWSVSGETMYFIDSTTQHIDAFDFNGEHGSISERRTLVEIDSNDGLPDGMTVDAEDCIWVALFGGGAIRRYTPDGVLDLIIELPVTNPTCPAFGGPGLETLYVTSARHRLSPKELSNQPLAGALFAIEAAGQGRPATPFAG